MAKRNGNWKIYLGLILTAALAGLGLAYNHGSQVRASQDTEKHVVSLKEDGCKPVGEVKNRVLVLETNYEHTKESLDKLETGQTTILEAIKTIKEK